MKVKIVKCSDRENSYRHLVGKVFEVNNSNHMLCVIVYGNCIYNISIKDTIPVNEIRYEKNEHGACTTKCPNDDYCCMVGSFACKRCDYNCSRDTEAQCSWQKESEEMDLKSIAVRFENVEQREAIRCVFKEKGFNVLEIISTEGVIGYADDDVYDYVCSLSKIGLQGKKIISYDEFIGGKEMKRLDVSLKIQPDGKTVVAECTHIDEELRGNGMLAEKNGYKLRSEYNTVLLNDILYVRGIFKEKDYNIFSYNFNSSQEAQEYVKIMNELIYEINNPKTDWSKVEEGAEVVFWLTCGNLKGQVIGKFNSYIPSLKKIVVICGEKVNVVDEEAVELC